MKDIPHLATAFAQILYEARRQARFSQAGLAREVGCARSFVSFLETAEHLPSLNAFLVLSRALGISSVDMLSRLESRLAALSAQSIDDEH
ncbi:MAG: helix-turn-helix domain-containing protein [Desulfovibrio sp.]|jgi:ribosome-binding protein aMBF1 (putative translation factor)|nr:helix-turn-helix domain-containing protein [Desulfovibrio sp.]